MTVQFRTTIGAPNGALMSQDAYDAVIGQPYGPGTLVAAEVADDGATVALTLDVPNDAVRDGVVWRDTMASPAGRYIPAGHPEPRPVGDPYRVEPPELKPSYFDRLEWQRRQDEYAAAERAVYDAVTDPRLVAVLDVLAPRGYSGDRSAIMVYQDEPVQAAEAVEVAQQVLASLDRVEL